MNDNNSNSTLLMVGIVAVVSMLSAAGLSIIPVQQASANLIGEDGNGGDTDFSFEQEQNNKCSGDASCSNTVTITFGLE